MLMKLKLLQKNGFIAIIYTLENEKKSKKL